MTSVVARYVAASTAMATAKKTAARNRRRSQRISVTTATTARTVPVSARCDPTHDQSVSSGVRCSASQLMTPLSQCAIDPVSMTSTSRTPTAMVASASAT